MHRRVIASLGLGSLISAICLWYAFRGLDLASVAGAMGRVEARWVAWSVVGALLSLVIRAIRWRLLLADSGQLGAWPLVSATFIGSLANNLLPARLGEVVRAWVLARHGVRSMPTVLASVVVERLLDVIAGLVLLGFGLAASPSLSDGAALLLKRTGIAVLALVAVGVVVLGLVLRFRDAWLRICAAWAARVDRPWASHGLDLFRRFLDGLWVLRGGAQAASLLALSVLLWGVAIFSFHVLADGFALGLTPIQTTLVFVMVLFGIAIPSAPGFVGTFHGFCVAGLTLVAGTEPMLAAAYATLLHGSQWLAVNATGAACLLADRSVTWAGVARLARQD